MSDTWVARLVRAPVRAGAAKARAAENRTAKRANIMSHFEVCRFGDGRAEMVEGRRRNSVGVLHRAELHHARSRCEVGYGPKVVIFVKYLPRKFMAINVIP